MGRKLLIFLFLCSCGSGGGSSGSGGSAFCGGSGSASDPYLVCNPVSFKEIKNHPSASFRISRDITLDGSTLDQIETFTGSIDNPNSYKIQNAHFLEYWIKTNKGTIDGLHFPNLKITGVTFYFTFIYINEGTIQNVNLNLSQFDGLNDNSLVSAITQNNRADGVIKAASVTMSVPKGRGVAGITLFNDGQIIDPVISSTSIKVTKAGYGAGGITYSNLTSGVITRAVVQTTTISGIENIGGVAGSNSGTINKSISHASVQGSKSIGGLAGSSSGTIHQSYSSGPIVGTTEYIGGLVGFNSGNISESAAIGNVGGTGNTVGGLVGLNYGSISNSYAGGDVTGNDRVGGFVGDLTLGSIINCYSSGSPLGNTWVGGFAGAAAGNPTISSCYWDTDGSGTAISGACTGKTSAEMKNQGTFTGWNFTNTWIMKAGEYPKLRWMNP